MRMPAMRNHRQEQDGADAEQQQQQVAGIGAGHAQPIGRRPSRGGAERWIGRAVGRERDRAGQAERRPAARRSVRTANRRTASRSASRQSGARSRFGARVATVAMSHPLVIRRRVESPTRSPRSRTSLRAQRSNPELWLDCFVAFAPRNDESRGLDARHGARGRHHLRRRAGWPGAGRGARFERV